VKASSTSSSDSIWPFVARCAGASLLGCVIWTLCTALFFDGYTDDFYRRVASPRQPSLILGTSRAAQGIVPQEIDTRSLGFAGPLFNFAFTSANSRYGRAYLEAIRRKLSPSSASLPGLFLLEVSPLSISTDKAAPEHFPEDDVFLAKLHSFSLDPNPEYPFYAADRGYQILYRMLRRWRGSERLFLHEDGWLEVKPFTDEQRLAANLHEKLADYAEQFASSTPSEHRLAYLRRTLQLLSEHGRAVLVRVPIHPSLAARERDYMPDFDARIDALARESKASYLDLSDLNGSVKTNDGNHLQRDVARQVSRELSARLALLKGT
jgi:hypothetical protein